MTIKHEEQRYKGNNILNFQRRSHQASVTNNLDIAPDSF
jgi:hypothetical protein